MRKFTVRLSGCLMTSLAIALLLGIHATKLPTRVLASPCCEWVQAEDDSCRGACSTVGDSYDCNIACGNEYAGLWGVCVWCSLNQPRDGSCYTCSHDQENIQFFSCSSSTYQYCQAFSGDFYDQWTCNPTYSGACYYP